MNLFAFFICHKIQRNITDNMRAFFVVSEEGNELSPRYLFNSADVYKPVIEICERSGAEEPPPYILALPNAQRR